MSAEDAENVTKNKLIEVLEEEISALNLGEPERENVEKYENDNLSLQDGEIESVDEQDNFRSSDDNTAEFLQKAVDVDHSEVECEIYEKALDPPPQNVKREEISRQKNYPQEGREYARKDNSYDSVNECNVDKYLRQNYKDGKDKVYFSNEETFVPPSDSLAEKIMRRAELYFQDSNIFKNSFLLNHIRRNRKGYVSLKLVSSLRKIKALTKDSRVVAYSLTKSKILEINPENNKIRRRERIPKIEDTSFGKTVMVFNLPQQTLKNEYLQELFSKFGTVVSVGTYEVNSPESDAYHERCLYFHRKIASELYGIVEFEKYNAVVNALKDENGHLPKENEMIVVPLMPQIYNRERRYLSYLDIYYPYPRRGSGRFRPRNEPRTVRNETSYANGGSGEIMRNGKMDMGSFQLKRGYLRRPYRGRRAFVPPNSKNYSEGPTASDYVGSRSNKWKETRQLKCNNSFNIDRFYPNVQRKKPGNIYAENGV